MEGESAPGDWRLSLERESGLPWLRVCGDMWGLDAFISYSTPKLENHPATSRISLLEINSTGLDQKAKQGLEHELARGKCGQ